MPESLDTFINPEQYAAIQAPLEKARTLPRSAFTSDAFFELEVKQIFSRRWIALCFNQQLPNVGDLLPVEFSGIPLLVVRGDDGALRVFHNIVPYDGCLAIINPMIAQKEITTPYHGWRYDLRGKLIDAPYWNGQKHTDIASLQPRPVNLIEVRSQTYMGILFVDLSGASDDFKNQIAPLEKLFSDYRIDDIAIGCDENGQPLLDEENLATNWKTHYENWAINVLHEAFTHEIYAESPQIPRVNNEGKKTYIEHIDDPFMALCYRERDFTETYDLDELPFTHLGKKTETLPEQSFIGSLFPNVHLAVFPYFIHMIIAHPVSAGQTHTVRAQFYASDSASNPDYLEDRLEIMDGFIQAGIEDGCITQAVQKARRSPVYEQQFYAPFWDRMHYHFSNQVLDALSKNQQNKSNLD